MEACKRSTQKQKQRVEEQQLGLTVVLLPLNFYSYHLPAQKRKLLQHPFPSRNYMHRLPIYGKLLFLIQRNDVTLRQIIDFHRLL